MKVVFLTNGVRGDLKHHYAAREYVALRRWEARQACQKVLGVADLEFWEYEDGALIDAESSAARLRRLIVDYRPTLVYAPSPQEFHVDHRASALIVWTAIRHLRHEFLIAFYEINRPIHVNTLVDISLVIDAKRRACDTYATQLVNYPYTDCTLALNRYRALTVSPSCRYAEGYVVIPMSHLRDQSPDAFAHGCLPPRIPTAESTPLVSIIVRTADRPALLVDALASLVAQHYSNLEVIVVNDGGGEVADVLASFGHRFVIRQVRHDTPRGRAEAANSGLMAARGKYINFLDDDDRLYPEHVLKLVSYLEKTGELVAYSDCELGRYEFVDEQWRLIGERALFMGVDYDWNRLHVSNYIAIMCPMFRRDLLERVEPMDKSLEFMEDWDFWLRMGACTPFQRLPGITAEYRVFTGPKYDIQRWHLAVCRKHESYWCVENLYALGRDLAGLVSKSQQLEGALGAAEAALTLIMQSMPMRLSRFARRFLPDFAVRWLRGWGRRDSSREGS